MAISLKHNFQSAVADEGDTSVVRPSNWNAEHDLTLATSRLVGRTTAGTGSAEEISVGTGLDLSSGTLAVSSTTPQVNSINTFTVTPPTLITYLALPTTLPTPFHDVSIHPGLTLSLPSLLNIFLSTLDFNAGLQQSQSFQQ